MYKVARWTPEHQVWVSAVRMPWSVTYEMDKTTCPHLCSSALFGFDKLADADHFWRAMGPTAFAILEGEAELHELDGKIAWIPADYMDWTHADFWCLCMDHSGASVIQVKDIVDCAYWWMVPPGTRLLKWFRPTRRL